FQKTLKQPIHPITLNIHLKQPNHHPHLNHIFKIIHHTTLPQTLKYPTNKIFQIIPQPPPKIHPISFQQLHFHQLPPIHSIIHIIPPCIPLQQLPINTLYSSPIPTR
ncbi:nickel insertion protein, partial [Staphylococcus epidermidis]|uniref:nickel insertion protein n=1 Tax=Staphylococcus epidermidis TaxID=1282 RepID=UPI0011A045CD